MSYYQVTSGRVLVTGGGGNIGKHIVRRFLAAGTPVTILDTIFHEDELELSTLPSSSASLLQVHIGDVRNITALSSVFTEDISGAVHLAAISQPEWCTENEEDCFDVNERGTQMVLEALARLNSRDQGRRWFILASSLDIYDIQKNEPGHESAGAVPATVYGATKVAAEEVVERYLMDLGVSSGRIHAAALRLSNVYGSAYDHLERLVPSLVTQALSHLVIQLPSGKQHYDLLHIDDCVDAFLLTIEHLIKSVNGSSFITPRTSFQDFDIASGSLTSAGGLVDSLVALTSSKSPIRHMPQVGQRARPDRESTEKAWRVLGFRASIGTDEGLLRLVKAYLRRTETFLRERIKTTCGKASPSITINNLEKLHDCSIHMQVNVQGEFQAFMTPGGEEEFWTTSSIAQTSEALIYMPAKLGKERQLYSIKAINDDFWLGVTHADPGPIQLPRITSGNISRNDPTPVVKWELELKPDDYTAVRLVVPGTDLYLMSPTIVGGNFTIVSKKTKNEWPFRVTPICCDAPGPWPFFRDDPLEYTIEYQRTSLERPFLGSPSKALCDRLERALDKVEKELATISITKLMISRRKMSRLPTDWINANTLACSNLCEHPTICVDTGDCQCVLSTCVPRKRSPVSSSGAVSFPPPEFENSTLVEMVERSSWRNVLRPQALSFVGAHVPFPRVHVSSIPESDDKWNRENGIYKFESQHCFTADSQLERAARLTGVQPSGAEMTFVPFYQARRDGNENYNHALETVEGFDATKVIMPVTHDWGGCMHFEWGIWQQREAVGLKVHPHIRSATVWSVMADINSPCYRPYQDVAIPPRSGRSPELFQGLHTVANVRPARDRRVLVTYSGSQWGTGKLNRMRVQCSRAGWDDEETEKRLHPDGPKLRTIFGGTGGYNYIELLNDTIFCPQPGGIVGWTWRIVESVYSGCIPILIGQVSQFPFFDMIDWGKISVQVDSSELDRLEDILLSRYTLKDIERLQTNLMLIRNAFIYPLDEASEGHVKEMMVDDRGPLWFALHSTKMRMLTMWPINF